MTPQTPFKRLILRAFLRDVYPMVIRLVGVPDLPLQWGDRVENPAIEGVDPIKWKELIPATQNYLNTVLARPILLWLRP